MRRGAVATHRPGDSGRTLPSTGRMAASSARSKHRPVSTIAPCRFASRHAASRQGGLADARLAGNQDQAAPTGEGLGEPLAQGSRVRVPARPGAADAAAAYPSISHLTRQRSDGAIISDRVPCLFRRAKARSNPSQATLLVEGVMAGSPVRDRRRCRTSRALRSPPRSAPSPSRSPTVPRRSAVGSTDPSTHWRDCGCGDTDMAAHCPYMSRLYRCRTRARNGQESCHVPVRVNSGAASRPNAMHRSGHGAHDVHHSEPCLSSTTAKRGGGRFTLQPRNRRRSAVRAALTSLIVFIGMGTSIATWSGFPIAIGAVISLVATITLSLKWR